jgi:hypothetical protein
MLLASELWNSGAVPRIQAEIRLEITDELTAKDKSETYKVASSRDRSRHLKNHLDQQLWLSTGVAFSKESQSSYLT